MHIFQQLKRLRKQRGLTLNQLALKAGYKGTGNLSDYENGNIKVQEKTMFRILTKGFDMTKEEAKKTYEQWQIEQVEAEWKGKLTVLQHSTNHNDPKVDSVLEMILKIKGLEEKEIEEMKKEIEQRRKE